jgi:prepilin-type N-terminal cleavage/methylation domain-containing protein
LRRGFSLLEVLLAALILGVAMAAILTSLATAQKIMLGSVYLETAQEVMDLGEMAYPLDDVREPDRDLDVADTKATELWEMISDERLTRAQEEKFKGYTWRREWINKNDDDEIKRLGGLHVVKVTVKWGDDLRGHHEEESYVTFWRKQE